jgi:hypothetical protein
MSDQSTLRQKAREAILAGKLPCRRPERIWAGPSAGSRCRICDKLVERDEIECELEFTGDHDDRGQPSCRVHFRCFAAWEYLCRYFEAGRAAISTSSPMQSATLPATARAASEPN